MDSKYFNRKITESEALKLAKLEYEKYLNLPISNAYFLVKESKMNHDSVTTVNKDKLPSND